MQARDRKPVGLRLSALIQMCLAYRPVSQTAKQPSSGHRRRHKHPLVVRVRLTGSASLLHSTVSLVVAGTV